MTEKISSLSSRGLGGHLGVAQQERPCVFCGKDTAIRVHHAPAHGGCWEQAGRPAQLPGATTPTDDPGPSQPPAAEPRRRNPTAESGFTVEPAAEQRDFLAALRRRVPDASPQDAAVALERWHEHVQVSGQPLRFVSNAGRTGIVAFEWLTARHGAMRMPAQLASERAWELARSQRVLRVLSWTDPEVPLTPEQHVVETDVHAQYLAAAHSTKCGDGEPDQLDTDELAGIDPLALVKVPGYLTLAAAPDLRSCPPHVQHAFAGLEPGSVLPTPLAAYLVRDHQVALPLESAVAWWRDRRDEHGKTIHPYGPRLSRWAGLFVPAREQLLRARHDGDHAAGLAVQVLKSTYSTFLGGLLRSVEHNDTDTLRPDWSDQVMAQASANMLRHLDKVWAASAARPLGGMKDAVWWPTDTTLTLPEGLQISDEHAERPWQPGKWHPTRWTPATDEIRTAHTNGTPTALRKAIISGDHTRRANRKS
ncbi:hypothetical protein [Saccharopolyspora cebuensis]|uniref:hypothetical protein n=1 Tax=Saccharopolyspora cebuensis TaxID=418759 RepID=UPI0031EF02A5